MFDQWQLLRKNLSPTFTQGKLNAMMSPMETFADAMVRQTEIMIKDSIDGEIDVDLLYQGILVV